MVDQISSPTAATAARAAALHLAIEQLYFGYRAFTAQADRILLERGLGRVHHRILYFVGRHPHISVTALLAQLMVSKQALNGPLRQLVDLQLIQLDTAGHDRRVRQLSLTEEGAALEAELTATQMQQLQAVFGSVGSAAEQGWRQVMQQLARPD